MPGDEQQIKTKRETAAKARRLSQGLTLREDRERLLAMAKNLDAQADALERTRPMD
jgi:hypothetical protein